MLWLIVTFGAALTAALINFFDKYLIEKYLKHGGVGALVIFSSVIGLPISLLISIFNPEVFLVPPLAVLILILNGALYISWILPYYYALERDETSVVAPLFQMASVFTLALGFLFLGEKLSGFQYMGSFLVFVGTLGLVTEWRGYRGLYIKKDVLLLMLLSTLIIAANSVIFKYVALEVNSFWTATFWEFIGFFATSLVIYTFVGSYRTQFHNMIRNNGRKVVGINVINELLSTSSKMLLNFAGLLAPLALVSFVAEGFQPIFVLGIGVLLTVLFPKVIKEDISKDYIIKKIFFLFIMLLGTYLLS